MKSASIRLDGLEAYDTSVPTGQSKGFASAVLAISLIINRGVLGEGFNYKNPSDPGLERSLTMRGTPLRLVLDDVRLSDRTAFQIRHKGAQWILRLNVHHGESFLAASAELFFGDRSGLLENCKIYKL